MIYISQQQSQKRNTEQIFSDHRSLFLLLQITKDNVLDIDEFTAAGKVIYMS